MKKQQESYQLRQTCIQEGWRLVLTEVLWCETGGEAWLGESVDGNVSREIEWSTNEVVGSLEWRNGKQHA